MNLINGYNPTAGRLEIDLSQSRSQTVNFGGTIFSEFS